MYKDTNLIFVGYRRNHSFKDKDISSNKMINMYVEIIHMQINTWNLATDIILVH